MKNKKITPSRAQALALAADGCWTAIQKRRPADFGNYVQKSFAAQVAMFPAMVNDYVKAAIGQFAEKALGWKLAGAGGGGYLVLISQNKIPGAMEVRISRSAY